MKIWLKTKDSKRKIGGSAAIETHLVGLGLKVIRGPNIQRDVDGVVCWGVQQEVLPRSSKRVLNANCNRFNKMTHLDKFIEADLLAPRPEIDASKFVPFSISGKIALARNISHQKGLDIVVCKTREELVRAMQDRDFWVEWIPTRTEYRVWVFRDKVLAVYEKQFKGEGEYKGYIRNHRFGFEFVSRNMEGIGGMRELGKCSVAAVKCLDLDFGAVDVIRGKDGKFYVLEVNTAPNIDSPERKSGVELARCIKEWAENV